MSPTPLDLTWTAAGLPLRFALTEPDPTLELPDGRLVVLPLDGWLSLREVLRLLPGGAVSIPGAPRPTPTPRPGPQNRGKAWTSGDEAHIAEAFHAGTHPREIALAVGRTHGSVIARLVRLGHLSEEDAGLRYPAARLVRADDPLAPV